MLTDNLIQNKNKLYEKDKMNIIERFLLKYKEILSILFILVLILSITLTQVYPYIDFFPINGKYQNYNVVRRLFAGYIPFLEFPVYLGPLHLFLGSFLTKLLGGTFAASVLAYDFLSISTFILLIWIVCKSLNYKTISTYIMIIFLVTLPYNILYIEGPATNGFYKEMLYSETSARLVRALPLFLVCCFIWWIDASVKNEMLKNCLYGAVAGFALPCSNDFGVSTFAAVLLLVLLIKLAEKKSIKQIFCEECLFGLCATGVVFILVLLFSYGHIISWIKSNLGISQYQSWYFIGKKVFYLYQWNYYLVVLFCYSLIASYLMIKGICNKLSIKELVKFKILFLLGVTAFINAIEVHFFSSTIPYASLIILWVILIGYFFILIKFIVERISNNLLYIKAVAFFVCIICALTMIWININLCLSNPSINHIVPEMGGAIYKHAESIIGAKQYIGNNKIFSTYASALEDVTNQFQPSGYDYIIHALGNEAREKYMQAFNKKNFSYVATQKIGATRGWENWIMMANWFFYKEVYNRYEPIYSNDYLILYKEKNKETINHLPKITQIFYTPITESTGMIVLKTSENINGIADLKIDYHINKKKIFNNLFLYRTLLNIFDFNKLHFKLSHIYLSEKFPQNIPISIINGKGMLYLHALPKKGVILDVKSLIATHYYKTPMKYLEIESIDKENNCINAHYLDFKNFSYKNIKKIKIDQIEYKVKRVREDNVVRFYLKKKLPDIIQSNFLEIMK